MMSNTTRFTDEIVTYKIIFRGQILPGFDREDVLALCAKHMKLSQEQLDRMFSGRTIILKKDITQEQTRHFAQAFQEYGLLLHIVSESHTDEFTLEDLEKTARTQWKPPPQHSIYSDRQSFGLGRFMSQIKFIDFYIKGRISNLAFVNAQLLTWLCFFSLAILLLYLKKNISASFSLNILLYVFGFFAYSNAISKSVLRLHDINFSGMWVLIPASFTLASCFFPAYPWLFLGIWLINMGVFITLSFIPGSVDTNFYGDPPLVQAQINEVHSPLPISMLNQTDADFDNPRNDLFTKWLVPEHLSDDAAINTPLLFLDRYVYGRMERFTYLISQLIIWLLFACMLLTLKVFHSSETPSWVNIVLFCFGFCFYFYSCYITILRLHDAGYSGGWTLIGIFSIAFSGFLLTLGFLQSYAIQLNGFSVFINTVIVTSAALMTGTEQRNRYGPSLVSPQYTDKKQRTAAIIAPVVLAVMTSILILASIARS